MALMRNTIPAKTSLDCRVKFVYDTVLHIPHGVGAGPSYFDGKLFNETLTYCRDTFRGYVYYVEYVSGKTWAVEFFFKTPADAMLFMLRWGE